MTILLQNRYEKDEGPTSFFAAYKSLKQNKDTESPKRKKKKWKQQEASPGSKARRREPELHELKRSAASAA